MSFREDAMRAHSAQQTELALLEEQHRKEELDQNEKDLRRFFWESFEHEPETVDSEARTATLDGITLYLHINEYRDFWYWYLRRDCPDCGETLRCGVVLSLSDLGGELAKDLREAYPCPHRKAETGETSGEVVYVPAAHIMMNALRSFVDERVAQALQEATNGPY